MLFRFVYGSHQSSLKYLKAYKLRSTAKRHGSRRNNHLYKMAAVAVSEAQMDGAVAEKLAVLDSTTPDADFASKYDHYTFPTTNLGLGEGHPGHTTPEQNAKVLELRSVLEKEGYTERLDTHSMVSRLCSIISKERMTNSLPSFDS